MMRACIMRDTGPITGFASAMEIQYTVWIKRTHYQPMQADQVCDFLPC